MTKKIFTTLIFMVMLAIITSTGFADKDTYNVTISQVGNAWKIDPNPAPGAFGHSWLLINSHPTATILVIVWNKYGGVAPHTIPALSSVIHNIAVGDCIIYVFDPAGGQLLVKGNGAYCGACQKADAEGCPTLTQWGIFILIALIVGSAVFIMLKRRKATVPA